MKRKGLFPGWLLLLFLYSPIHAATPELVLLESYRHGMQISGWLMSEKLDGVRAWWDGRQLYSRKGNRIHAPDWFTRNLPPFELDGELWIDRGRFEETLSIVKDTTPGPGWERISYNIFEAPNEPGGLLERLGRLRDYLKHRKNSHVHIIDQLFCVNEQHLMEYLAEVEARGGEGLVLRNPISPYITGRTSNALKVKSFDDMEGRVIGYKPGKGKYNGMTGALRVELDDGTRFWVGSGLSDQDRASPPPIGSLVTFKYHGLTAKGIPRFASFMRVRESMPLRN